MKASHKYLKISYKKLNVVADLVRRKSVGEAQDFLKFAPKKAADLLGKILASAAANAEQKGMKKENLVIDEIKVTKGALHKRWRPVSKGRAHPYRKATSNCTILLKEGEEKVEKKVKKAEVKKEAPEKVEKKVEKKEEEKKVVPKKKVTKKKEPAGKIPSKAKIISKNKSK